MYKFDIELNSTLPLVAYMTIECLAAVSPFHDVSIAFHFPWQSS